MKYWTVLLLLNGAVAMGAVLEPQGAAAKEFNESGLKIPVHRQVRLKLPGVTPPEGLLLYATGAGLREKRIVFVDVNVYVATSYREGEGALGEDPLATLKQSPYRAIQLHMLRDLSADKIRSAFRDSLEENGVDLKAAPIQALLGRIDFEVKKGQVVTLVGYPAKGDGQGVWYEVGDKNFQVVGQGLADDFWSIWFGKPADGGLERLKAELVKPL